MNYHCHNMSIPMLDELFALSMLLHSFQCCPKKNLFLNEELVVCTTHLMQFKVVKLLAEEKLNFEIVTIDLFPLVSCDLTLKRELDSFTRLMNV